MTHDDKTIQGSGSEQIRVNWIQGQIASDKRIRAHNILGSQPLKCQFVDMVNYTDFSSLNEAEDEMRRRGHREYKSCKHCWDDAVVPLYP